MSSAKTNVIRIQPNQIRPLIDLLEEYDRRLVNHEFTVCIDQEEGTSFFCVNTDPDFAPRFESGELTLD